MSVPDLFGRYGADSGAIRAAAAQAGAAAGEFTTVGADLRSRATAAAGFVDGDIAHPVDGIADPVIDQAQELARAALLAQGGLNSFAGAVDAYDATIAQLNARYAAARASSFGISADAGAREGMTDRQKQDARHALIATADRALQAQLERERQAAEDQLDDTARDVASRLDAGPTTENLLAYELSGDIAIAPEQVFAFTGVTWAGLSELKDTVGSAASVFGQIRWSSNWLNLARWIAKINPADLTARIQMREAMMMREILLANQQGGLALADRLANFKAGKASIAEASEAFAKVWRDAYLVDGFNNSQIATKISAFIHAPELKLGEKLASLGPLAKLPALSEVAGKSLAPIQALTGAAELVETGVNWNHESTEQKVTGVVGGGANVIAGGIGTASLIYAAVGASAAFPPALVVVGVAAGAVAVGTLIYQNRKAIADTAVKVAHAATDFVEHPGKSINDAAHAAGKAIDDLGGALKKGLGSLFG